MNTSELLTGRSIQDTLHCVVAFRVVVLFLVSSAVILLCTQGQKNQYPILHSLRVCGHLNLRHLVFLGGTLTHFWRCDVWMCALCIYRWVPNGVGGWLPSSEFWQPSLDHKKGLPKAVVLQGKECLCGAAWVASPLCELQLKSKL